MIRLTRTFTINSIFTRTLVISRTMRTSNAVIEFSIKYPNPEPGEIDVELQGNKLAEKEVLLKETDVIMNYICNDIADHWTLSELLERSAEINNFNIARDSFIQALQCFLAIESPRFSKDLKISDDMGLYSFSGKEPKLVANCNAIYDKALAEVVKKQEAVNITNVPDTNAPRMSSESSSASGCSDTSIYFNENDTSIILLTIGTFIVINAIAWYVRTYHKEEPQGEDNEEALLHSTLEPFYLQDFVSKFIALLFPTIVMFYTFRYYHLYTLKKLMKYKKT